MSKYNWREESKNIYELSIQGKTLKEIGDLYGVTREYIRQVINKYYPTLTKNLRGKILNASMKREQVIKDRFDKRGRYTGQHLDDISRRMSDSFRRKRQNAKNSKWGWDLSFHDIEWNTVCPIFGVEIDWFAEKANPFSPSYDRVDPTLGYVKGNVKIISLRANVIKNNGTAHEHRLIAEYMDNHLIKMLCR